MVPTQTVLLDDNIREPGASLASYMNIIIADPTVLVMTVLSLINL
jgi:hypothetical protein